MSARLRATPWWGRRKAYPEELFGPAIVTVRWEGGVYQWDHRLACRVMG